MPLLLPAFTQSKRGDVDTLVNRVHCLDIFDLCALIPDKSVDMILRGKHGIIEASKTMRPREANTGRKSQHYKGVLTMPQYTTRVCPVCGKEYQADSTRLKHGRQTTCSRDCSYAYRSQQMRVEETFTCAGCNVQFTCQPFAKKCASHYCSIECYHRSRASRAGYESPKKGIVNCVACGKSFKSRNRDHKHCSRKCFETAHSERMAGENNPSYIDGRSALANYDVGADWHRIRLSVYKRDNYTCQHCGTKCVGKSTAMKQKTSEYTRRIIQCHHIVPYSISRDNSTENLITLCIVCHRAVHNGGGFDDLTSE